MAQPEKLIYRINEAATALGISRPTIYRLVKRGELHLIKIGGTTASGITAASIKAMIGRSGTSIAGSHQPEGWISLPPTKRAKYE